MAKRIEFTPGIEAMRGSFSPKQKLQYALHNNPAFEAPVGRQYARNYQANFVGAKRSATGLKYFFTKTKSATLVTVESKLRMAITGAAGAIFADIQRNATTANSIYYRLQYSWKEYYKSPKTFRAWCMSYIESMLTIKSAAVSMGRDAQSNLVTVQNPWYVRQRPGTAYVPQVGEELILKFWMQLANSENANVPMVFSVDGVKAPAFVGVTFSDLITDTDMSTINFLDLKIIDDGGTNIVASSDNKGLLKDGEDVPEDSVIEAINYVTAE